VTGTYRADQQVYVPGRAVDGEDAVLVITALRVTQGPSAGAMMPVLRGWVHPEDLVTDPVAAPADAAAAAELAVPEGEVTVTGYLKDSEAGRGSDLPEGMVGAVSSAELANLWGGPTWSGYLVEFTTTPDGGRSEVSPTGLRHAPPPGPAEDTSLNIQNLAYAVEWVIFGGFALALWVRMLRDDVRNRREDAGLV
jgi:cytochrome oxidase assembly protein ShyY1